MAQTPLQRSLAILRKRYGEPKPWATGKDPFPVIIEGFVAYLADDARRRKVFATLRKQIGITPQAILDASLDTLTAICRLGGPVAPQHRAERMKLVAAIVLDDFDGDLRQVFKLEYKKAVKALCTLPSIAEPGADRILMTFGAYPVLGMESSALRVLSRLGYGEETKNYHKTYRSARDAASAELPKKAEVMSEASLVLRDHGRATCKYTIPRCEECPLTARCNWHRIHTEKRS